MATMQEMIEAVKAHAIKHYEQDGWDTIVECYSDSEIAKEIEQGKCESVEQAIAYVAKGCKVYNDYRNDIRAEIF